MGFVASVCDPSSKHKAGATLVSNVKRGRWATLGLGLIAALVGQLAALMAVIWWCGLDLVHSLDPGSGPAAGTEGAAGGHQRRRVSRPHVAT
jgi:hypothetical protein